MSTNTNRAGIDPNVDRIARVRRAMRLPKGARVAIAMSGGVDSGVTASLLLEADYEVIGLTARLRDPPSTAIEKKDVDQRSCRTGDEIHDAQELARALGIPHHVIDERARFEADVVAPFAQAWLRGETPNPCVECNRSIKLDRLVWHSRALHAEALATGHYARLQLEEGGGFSLRRGLDPLKDQAYFLYPMTSTNAAFLRFPLGEFHKSEIREHALRLGLPVTERRESMDICFVGPEGSAAFVAKRVGKKAGSIVDQAGTELARHDNLAAFTVGQRRHLPLSHPGPDGRPRYVLETRPDGTIVVGPRERLRVERLVIEDFHPLGATIISTEDELEVQIRHRGRGLRARVLSWTEGRLELTLLEELLGMARGQSAVLFKGDRVLGGGIVREVWTRARALEPKETP